MDDAGAPAATETRSPAVHPEVGRSGPPGSTTRRIWLWAIVAAAVPAFGLPGMTWIFDGTVAALRCGVDLVMPVALVWLGLLAATAGLAASGRRLAVLFAALFLIWTVLGNGDFVGWTLGHVEPAPSTDPPAALEQRKLQRPLDALVVLGGGTTRIAPGLVEAGRDGERVVSAAQAWHSGTTKTIIVTGSSDRAGSEASATPLLTPRAQSQHMLESLGVPQNRIFAIEGVNTALEMKALASFLNQPPAEFLQRTGREKNRLPEDTRTWRVGLITSAFHMPRAMRLASRHELNLLPLPCAFRGSYTDLPWRPADWIPQAGNLDTLGLVVKETLARLAGR